MAVVESARAMMAGPINLLRLRYIVIVSQVSLRNFVARTSAPALIFGSIDIVPVCGVGQVLRVSMSMPPKGAYSW